MISGVRSAKGALWNLHYFAYKGHQKRLAVLRLWKIITLRYTPVFHTSAFRQAEQLMSRNVHEVLELLDLQSVRHEPAAGMNPHESEQLVNIIRDIHEQYQLAIFLIDFVNRMDAQGWRYATR
ncbi:hypothetical protein CSB45_13150 [candidate division KSB3 bacterium]|uniref:Uncharacterized protein n=1 Tax=candidate division KSB3 bacterium TaxID=2044937 RepID=A0A2G6E1R2_9BACT|nr:MAG: hypothetical protein CSB45_13150 [candidate division KSB3 bacterium]PIE28646.1 MAG: hypothetical protein CSA57_12805 [candidate division KSB3 bacterium]